MPDEYQTEVQPAPKPRRRRPSDGRTTRRGAMKRRLRAMGYEDGRKALAPTREQDERNAAGGQALLDGTNYSGLDTFAPDGGYEQGDPLFEGDGAVFEVVEEETDGVPKELSFNELAQKLETFAFRVKSAAEGYEFAKGKLAGKIAVYRQGRAVMESLDSWTSNIADGVLSTLSGGTYAAVSLLAKLVKIAKAVQKADKMSDKLLKGLGLCASVVREMDEESREIVALAVLGYDRLHLHLSIEVHKTITPESVAAKVPATMVDGVDSVVRYFQDGHRKTNREEGADLYFEYARVSGLAAAYGALCKRAAPIGEAVAGWLYDPDTAKAQLHAATAADKRHVESGSPRKR